MCNDVLPPVSPVTPSKSSAPQDSVSERFFFLFPPPGPAAALQSESIYLSTAATCGDSEAAAAD